MGGRCERNISSGATEGGADDARRRFAETLTGLDVRYDLGEGHALLGRRMPDLDLVGEQRLFTRMHDAEPLLLNLAEPGRFDVAPWAERVRRIDARAVGAPPAVLIRPDGHVAWVSDGTDRGLRDALSTWFGPPLTPSPAT